MAVGGLSLSVSALCIYGSTVVRRTGVNNTSARQTGLVPQSRNTPTKSPSQGGFQAHTSSAVSPGELHSDHGREHTRRRDGAGGFWQKTRADNAVKNKSAGGAL